MRELASALVPVLIAGGIVVATLVVEAMLTSTNRRHIYLAGQLAALAMVAVGAVVFATTTRPVIAASLIVNGGVVAAVMYVRRRRAPRTARMRTRWWADSGGLPTLVLSSGVVAGWIVDAWPASVVCFLGIVALIALEVRATFGALAYLERHQGAKSVDSKQWSFSIDGAGVVVRDELHVMHVHLGTTLPHAFELARAVTPTATTGDAAFDAIVDVRAPDELWRPLLTARVRDRLRTLFEGRDVRFAKGQLELSVPDQDVSGPGLVAWIRDAVAACRELASNLTDNPPAAVLSRVRDEPLATVRRGHYAWLLERGYERPHVLRAAASDPDPDIAAWAASQRPADGVYR